MITAKDLSDLSAGTLELKCGAMRLVQAGTGMDSGSLGSGYLRQTPTGELSLVMFVTSQPPPLEQVWDMKKKSGELFGEEDYYSLEATDFSGRRWSAQRVRPSFTQFHGKGEQLWLAEATVRELHCKESLSGSYPGASLRIWYRGDLEFPFQAPIRRLETAGAKTLSDSIAIGAAEFECAGYEFFVRHEAGYLVISASSSERSMKPDLERRVHETLGFVLARRLGWTAVERHEGTGVSSWLTGAPPNTQAGRMQPPVAFTCGIREECQAALNLFSRFLEQIAPHPDDALPLLSVASKCALEGSRAPLDAHALDVAVAVEAVLGLAFADHGQSDDRFREELALAQSTLESLAISDETKRRLRGRISSMAATSAKSRLLELTRRGVIDLTEVRAWETIRHQGAHGKFISGVDQDYVDAFWRLVTLFYRLVFAAVGYDGPYRDYGVLGWPWRKLR